MLQVPQEVLLLSVLKGQWTIVLWLSSLFFNHFITFQGDLRKAEVYKQGQTKVRDKDKGFDWLYELVGTKRSEWRWCVCVLLGRLECH